MNVAVIGFGNAGCKIAEMLLQYEEKTDRSLVRSVTAVNSAEIDLAKLDLIPEDRRILIGQTDERVKGRGVGANPDVGAEIARRDAAEVNRALDDVPFHQVDAFLVIAGLGGGTGSGGAPVISQTLRETYAEPVYGLGVLPEADEGGRASLNAARSLTTFAESTDNLILFDNDTWQQSGDSVEMGYARTNWELARRVATLLGAGEVDGSDVSENAMDASDVRRTLSTGGLSTIAYASEALEPGTKPGLLARFRADGTDGDADHATKVYGIVRKAVQSRLTCNADVATAERSLIVVSGPPKELSRKGLQRAREWLEDQTGSAEVMAGDDPRRDASKLAAVVVLSNVTDVPPVKALQERGVDAKANIEAQEAARDDDIQRLIRDDAGELDPV